MLPPPRAGCQPDGVAEGPGGRAETPGEIAGPAQPGQPSAAGPAISAAAGSLQALLEKRGGTLGIQQPPDITSGRQAAGQHHIVTEQPGHRQGSLDSRERGHVVASDESQLRQPDLGAQPHHRPGLTLGPKRRPQPPQPGH